MAERGLPGKAVRHASSEGRAQDTPEVEAIIRAKFPSAPAHQARSSRLPAPPSNEFGVELVAKAILGFSRGAAPGPSGHRPEFYK